MSLFAWTRQFTGTPRVHRAYVRSRITGKPLLGCKHKHRSEAAAMRCAEKMLSKIKENP